MAKYIGSYKKVSQTCSHDWLESDLSVALFTERSVRSELVGKGYWIASKSGGFAVTALDDDSDWHKCTLTNNGLFVEIDGNKKPNPPENRNVSFLLTGTQITFSVDACMAIYSKQLNL